MENDTTEKSLAQIGFEAVRPLAVWNAAGPALQEMSQDFAAAVEAEVLRRQTSPAMAGELGEEEVGKLYESARHNSQSERAWWPDVHRDSKAFHREFARLIFALRPVSPITQTPQLTEEDRNDLLNQAHAMFNGTTLSAGKAFAMLAHEIPKRLSILATPEAETLAYREAVRLATAIWNAHYSLDAHAWQPLETTAGVISQIDNMYAGLRSKLEGTEKLASSPRIYTKCPACGNDTLTINDDKHLLCTWHKCPDPTLIDKGPLSARPGYHKTSDNPPTERDANADGAVLGWSGGRWTDVHWNQEWRGQGPGCMATKYPFWKPQPPAPVSPVTAEEAEFKKALNSAGIGVIHADLEAFRELFEAGRKLGEVKKSEGEGK